MYKKKYKKFEVEVENTQDAILAAQEGATIIMLDNFTPTQIIKTIKILRNKKLRKNILLEASGGITIENARAYAEAGVDYIAVGALTHSAPNFDIGLDMRVE